MGVSKLRETRKEEKLDENANEKGYGSIVVIENVFAYKQVIPLQLGDNIIGRYMKNSGINCPIETVDPSVDMNHCVINAGSVQQRNSFSRGTSMSRVSESSCAPSAGGNTQDMDRFL